MKHDRKNKPDHDRKNRFGPYGRACGTANRSCSYCSGNRTHKHDRRAPATDESHEG